MVKQQLSTNTFLAATWIVNTTAGLGSHTTLAGALASASSGDTILLQSSVTENPTLVAGVNIFAPIGSELTPNVTITGKCTFSTAGTVTMSGIRFTTNSDFAIAVTGSAASVLNLENCYLNCSNTTGISYSSSSGSSQIILYNCNGNLGTTGIGYFTSTGSGSIEFLNGIFNNTGASSTTSTTSTSQVTLDNVQFAAVLATTSTGTFVIINSLLNPIAVGVNTTCLTTVGTGVSSIYAGFLQSGTASAVSIGTGTTVSFYGIVDILSSNTNAITGAGTFGGNATFSGASSLNNTTTKTAKNMDIAGLSFDFGSNIMSAYTVGTWTPTMIGASTAGTTTYTAQGGYYVRVGAIVQVQCVVACSAATGTGNLQFGSLPFTIKNQSSGTPYGALFINNSMTFPVGTTTATVNGNINTTTAIVGAYGSVTNASAMQIANASLNLQWTLVHQI